MTGSYRTMATGLRSMRTGVHRLSETLDRAIEAIDALVASPDDVDAQVRATQQLNALRDVVSAVPIPTHGLRGDQWT